VNCRSRLFFNSCFPRECQTFAPGKICPRATGHYRIFRSRILGFFCAGHDVP
jgi:hypothetical protein